MPGAVRYLLLLALACGVGGARGQALPVELFLQADSLYRAGDYAGALKGYTACLADGSGAAADETGFDYPTLANGIALCHQRLGDFSQALHYHREALQAGEALREVFPSQYAGLLCDYATCYIRTGKSSQAVPLYLQAQPWFVLGEDPSGLSTLYNNLAAAYSNMADYGQALRYFDSADSLNRACGLPDSYRVATFNNRAHLYTLFGNYPKATEYYTAARSLTAPESGQYIVITQNMADLATRQRRYDDAKRLCEQALEQGGGAADSLAVFRQQGLIYARQGNGTLSARILAQARALTARTYPAGHPEHIAQLVTEATCSEACGRMEEACERYRKAYGLSSVLFGGDNPQTVSLLYGLAKSELMLGHNADALRDYRAYIAAKLDFLERRFYGMAEDEQAAFWRESREGLLAAPLFCSLAKSQEGPFAGEVYDIVLLCRRLLFASAVDFERSVRESGGQALYDDYLKMQDYRIRSRQQLLLPVSRRTADCAALDSMAMRIERELRQQLAHRGGDLSDRVRWQDIVSRLGQQSVAVEFTDFESGDERVYAALVLRKGWNSPRMVTLCNQRELMAAMDGAIPSTPAELDACYSGDRSRRLYDLIWKPLEASVRERDTLWFAPSGLLHNLPLECLSGERGIIADRCASLCRLSSTAVLLHPPARVKFDRAVLYGAIDYLENAQQRGQEDYFDVLRQGASEITRIRKQVQPFMPVRLRWGAEATKSDFKSLEFTPGEHVLLHFSTHGFYLPDSLAGQRTYYKHMQASVLRDFPLLRSGLAMAGANRVWSGRQAAAADGDDGILTAQEIAAMDLRCVDLVVLAACQTAQGDVTNDGVAGLQQAFKRAGARSLIVSLWSTNDTSTAELMGHLYRFLMQGDNHREALDKARRALREEPRFASPYHWAAFVALD